MAQAQQSGPEVKNSLRKLDFPVCAKEALIKIGQLMCNKIPSLKHMDLALDLMAELVFCEVDRRGNKRPTSLSAIDELQLLEVLYDYFSSIFSDTARNSVFLSLFSGTTAMMRATVLGKLTSIAIAMQSSSLLISASTWMQQLGSTSPNSNHLAKMLIKDYFLLSPNAYIKLKALPKIAPQFTTNFITAIANIYFSDGKREPFMFPPANLLECVTHWVNENSGLCIAAQQMQLSLPLGAIAMEATTPIAGLLKWCILAPIYNEKSELYGQLHLGLLNSMLEIPQAVPPKAISANHLLVPAGNINRYIANVHTKLKKSDIACDQENVLNNDSDLQLCLERYAQAIQVAFSVNCIYGNLESFLVQLLQLPKNRLLSIVINTHSNNNSEINS